MPETSSGLMSDCQTSHLSACQYSVANLSTESPQISCSSQEWSMPQLCPISCVATPSIEYRPLHCPPSISSLVAQATSLLKVMSVSSSHLYVVPNRVNAALLGLETVSPSTPESRSP